MSICSASAQVHEKHVQPKFGVTLFPADEIVCLFASVRLAGFLDALKSTLVFVVNGFKTFSKGLKLLICFQNISFRSSTCFDFFLRSYPCSP